MSSAAKIVYIVDDEAGMRKALCRLLKAEGFDPRPFASAGEFLESYRVDEAACLLLDVTMPEINGMELQNQLSRLGLQVPIVFLTAHGDIPMSVKAIKAGASDFLTKPVTDADLLRSVRTALEISAARSAEQTARMAVLARHATLTPREREVMAYVVAGMLNKQIAARLGTGEQNIKIHRGRVMEKMEVSSLADLVRTAELLGIGKAGDV